MVLAGRRKPELEKTALAVKPGTGNTVAIVTDSTDQGRYVIRHSTAHMRAQAVLDLFERATSGSDAPLGFLGDIFHTPAWMPIHNVFSVGDIEIVLGAFLLLHFVCRSRLVDVPVRLRPA